MSTLSESRRNSLASKAQRAAEALLLPEATHCRAYWSGRGFSVEAAVQFGVGWVIDGPYADRLSIPYLTPSGLPWTIKYRCITQHDCKAVGCPKYLYDSGSEHHLFNAGVLADTPPVVVVTEGELDAIAVQTLVGVPAVGYPGVQAFQQMKHFPYCFTDIAEVVIIADYNEPKAGETVGAGLKAANTIAGMLPQGRVVQIPAGEDDANSYLLKYGPEAFKRLAEL